MTKDNIYALKIVFRVASIVCGLFLTALWIIPLLRPGLIYSDPSQIPSVRDQFLIYSFYFNVSFIFFIPPKIKLLSKVVLIYFFLILGIFIFSQIYIFNVLYSTFFIIAFPVVGIIEVFLHFYYKEE